MAFDPKHLPEDPKALQQMVLDLMAQLDREFTERSKIEALLRELLDAKRNRKSEQLSADQLALFAAAWQARQAAAEASESSAGPNDENDEAKPGAGEADRKKKPGGRQPLPRHLKRERILHDLPDEEKHCDTCQQDLRPIGEESGERYEYIPAQLTVIEDVCKKYACACTVKTATKPSQPIEKSTAGASLLAQVIVAKCADHLPLHRQEKIFERHGVAISRKSMCGWMAQCADLLNPLYVAAKEILFESKVIGTDDTSVKVLDRKLPFARTGRIWPYYGDHEHPVILYDYTPTRERAGPEKFLTGYRGYLQADAYGGYDAFFRDPARGLIEVGCWAHARRYFHKALESDQARMGPALLLIAQLYRVEKQARLLKAEDRLEVRQLHSRPILDKLHQYLLEIQAKMLPKSPEGRAVRYALKNWKALTRYSEDGNLEIDNNRTERTIRGVAVGRSNWMFFGSDIGGRTAAVLRSFVASCQRVNLDPFAWFKDVLARIASHSINRIAELLPHNWASAQA
ncbi:MAG: IS66 family transposase [Acidobacteriales bacterium]|nr:IS66 family transposase [Terriglobales bacterium]